MSLRIRAAASPSELEGAQPADNADGWATRLAKLMPAEALGLYGAASSLIPAVSLDVTASARNVVLWILALVCLVFSAAIRLRATEQGGKPQVTAVAIASISFVIWLTALGPPNSPVQLPNGYAFIGPLIAVVWATIISYFYRGDQE